MTYIALARISLLVATLSTILGSVAIINGYMAYYYASGIVLAVASVISLYSYRNFEQ